MYRHVLVNERKNERKIVEKVYRIRGGRISSSLRLVGVGIGAYINPSLTATAVCLEQWTTPTSGRDWGLVRLPGPVSTATTFME